MLTGPAGRHRPRLGGSKVPGSRCDQPMRPNEKGDRPSWTRAGQGWAKVSKERCDRRQRIRPELADGSDPRVHALHHSPSRSAVVVNNNSERDRNLANRQRSGSATVTTSEETDGTLSRTHPWASSSHLSPRSSLRQTTVESNKMQGRKGRHES